MPAWMRALGLGVLSWLLPFVFSVAIFPLKKSNPPLFSTLMFLAVLLVAGVLLIVYFIRREVKLIEASVVGVLWLAMNLVIDYPLFAYGPMKMTVLGYYSEIGLVYLTFPLVAIFASQLARR